MVRLALKTLGLLYLSCLSIEAQSKDFGTLGHTFEIIEADLLEMIQDKLETLRAKGTLLEHQRIIQSKTIEALQNPKPLLGLIKTKQARAFEYNPSFQVGQDLKDHEGRIFVKAGTLVNPLDYFRWSQKLVFIDGEDALQLQWALKQDAKIILVKGAPLALAEQYQRPIYFDQNALLTQKLGIRQIPAQVVQEDQRLKIEELLVEEDT
jgi:conjugal transfer pilus assembly protein TraW